MQYLIISLVVLHISNGDNLTQKADIRNEMGKLLSQIILSLIE